MNLREARKQGLMNAMAGNATLFESPSGMGKSDMIDQIAQHLQANEPTVRWGYCTFFAATQTPPDLIGYQFKGERTYEINGAEVPVTITDPSVPLWFMGRCMSTGKILPAFLFDKVILHIEEYGQGEADVKRACAEIFLKGGTPPWYLPAGSVRFASTNKGARYGVTKDFDFAIARRSIIPITGDVECWLSDFADKPYVFQGRQWQVMGMTKAWAASNPAILFEPEPKEQGPWCNPRTLTALDRYLQVASQFNNGDIPTDAHTTEVMAGSIGMPATQSLIGHIQFRTQLPSYAEVVGDPTGTAIPTRADLLLLMAYELAGWTQKADLPQCITYMSRMPKDMAVTYVTALLRRDYKGLINEPAMQAWIGKNAALVSIIASLSQ